MQFQKFLKNRDKTINRVNENMINHKITHRVNENSDDINKLKEKIKNMKIADLFDVYVDKDFYDENKDMRVNRINVTPFKINKIQYIIDGIGGENIEADIPFGIDDNENIFEFVIPVDDNSK